MDKKIRNLLARIKQDNGVTIIHDGELARIFGKQPSIRKLRLKDQIYIAKDRKKGVTLIYKKNNHF